MDVFRIEFLFARRTIRASLFALRNLLLMMTDKLSIPEGVCSNGISSSSKICNNFSETDFLIH